MNLLAASDVVESTKGNGNFLRCQSKRYEAYDSRVPIERGSFVAENATLRRMTNNIVTSRNVSNVRLFSLFDITRYLLNCS